MRKKYLILIIIIIILIILLMFEILKNFDEKEESICVLDDLSELENAEYNSLDNNKFYTYKNEENNNYYLVFKIWEATYTSYTNIEKINFISAEYDEEKLELKLDINVKSGESENRCWPSIDEKYVVMKIEHDIDELIINGNEYEKL